MCYASTAYSILQNEFGKKIVIVKQIHLLIMKAPYRNLFRTNNILPNMESTDFLACKNFLITSLSPGRQS